MSRNLLATTPISSLDGTEYIYTVKGGVDGRATVSQISSYAAAVTSAPGEGVNFITANTSADNATANGAALLASYVNAKLLTPSGAALSATNRAVLFVPPGKYDLGTTPLVLDAQFVDLVGVSGQPEHVLITSAVATANSGTVVQTANDVLIARVTLENTQVSRTNLGDSSDPSAYMPSTNQTLAKLRNVVMSQGASSRSMRSGIIYSGIFTGCTAGDFSFGGIGGTASGTFTNCIGGDNAFGGEGGCTSSGTFTNCIGGAHSFGYGGATSGTFTNCTGTGYGAFGGTASGTFMNCMGFTQSFGGGGTASGIFTNCTGGSVAFGGYGTASGIFTNCTGGSVAFGYNGTASGTFTNCTGADNTFGGTGVASGTFTNCTGGNAAFAGGGILSGKLYNCRLAYGTFPVVQARTFTVTIATPGVFSLTSHGFTTDTKIRFTTTGALPTGLAVGTTYFVLAANLSTNTFNVSTTSGGTAINTAGSQSGTHTVSSGRTVNCIDGFDVLNNQ